MTKQATLVWGGFGTHTSYAEITITVPDGATFQYDKPFQTLLVRDAEREVLGMFHGLIAFITDDVELTSVGPKEVPAA